jgi:PBP1b-binding outer membrane lipoprotein LpoB
MFKSKTRLVYIAILSASVFILQGCDNGIKPDKKVEIKPAPKLTNDATVYAQKAWTLINLLII